MKATDRWNNLDAGIGNETGKRVYYQLTDAELGIKQNADGTWPEPGGDVSIPTRKVPAVIDYSYPESHRGETGSEFVASLTIFRPLHKGGVFQKDNVEPNGARVPGTYDQIQAEDRPGQN